MPNLGCSPNAASAYAFLVGKGLRDFQAAAIVGNLQQESGVNPTVAPGDNGTAFGIAQWHNPRWANLQTFAAQRGMNPYSLEAQLEFLWHELETIPAFGLKAIESSYRIEDAVVAFQDNFERCGVCATANRIHFAYAAMYACPVVRPPIQLTERAPSGFLAVLGIAALAAGAALASKEAIYATR